MAGTGQTATDDAWAGLFWIPSCAVFIATLVWCWSLTDGNKEKASLAFMLCTAAFACGSMFGFLFTIFGDEQEPFGKIRDAMIALASGITGVGIGKASDIGQLIGSVHVFRASVQESSWFAVLLVTAYFVAGFYFMYFARILFFNPKLAEGRRATEVIKTLDQASIVAIKVTESLPPSFLLGRDFISEEDDLDKDGSAHLKGELFGEDVGSFLKACNESLERGSLQSE